MTKTNGAAISAPNFMPAFHVGGESSDRVHMKTLNRQNERLIHTDFVGNT